LKKKNKKSGEESKKDDPNSISPTDDKNFSKLKFYEE